LGKLTTLTSHLRFSSLIALERGLIYKKNFYSTIKVIESELDPYWVTGFADAESSFSLKVSRKSTSKIG
jgi:hypothetical protein